VRPDGRTNHGVNLPWAALNAFVGRCEASVCLQVNMACHRSIRRHLFPVFWSLSDFSIYDVLKIAYSLNSAFCANRAPPARARSSMSATTMSEKRSILRASVCPPLDKRLAHCLTKNLLRCKIKGVAHLNFEPRIRKPVPMAAEQHGSSRRRCAFLINAASRRIT
jgi:hypothetical protein